MPPLLGEASGWIAIRARGFNIALLDKSIFNFICGRYRNQCIVVLLWRVGSITSLIKFKSLGPLEGIIKVVAYLGTNTFPIFQTCSLVGFNPFNPIHPSFINCVWMKEFCISITFLQPHFPRFLSPHVLFSSQNFL